MRGGTGNQMLSIAHGKIQRSCSSCAEAWTRGVYYYFTNWRLVEMERYGLNVALPWSAQLTTHKCLLGAVLCPKFNRRRFQTLDVSYLKCQSYHLTKTKHLLMWKAWVEVEEEEEGWLCQLWQQRGELGDYGGGGGGKMESEEEEGFATKTKSNSLSAHVPPGCIASPQKWRYNDRETTVCLHRVPTMKGLC